VGPFYALKTPRGGSLLRAHFQWVKRDAETGKFTDVKQDDGPFKGVSKER
jgi:hypothetical protein